MHEATITYRKRVLLSVDTFNAAAGIGDIPCFTTFISMIPSLKFLIFPLFTFLSHDYDRDVKGTYQTEMACNSEK